MKSNITNELLFEDVKNGDEYAFKIIFVRFYKKLCRHSLSIVKSSEVAEEIAVDILLQLWVQRVSIKITTDLGQYLYRSAYNRSLNHLRDSRRRDLKITYVEEHTVETLGVAPALGDFFSETNDISYNDQLEDMLINLPEPQQQILILRRKGLMHKEIAKKLEMPEKKVRNIVERTLQKLREQLKYSSLKKTITSG